MKLFDAYSERGFHTSVATTFAIDFEAYEQITLSRLRESGCMNNIVLADSRMVTHALQDAQRPPAHAGRRYSLAGAHTDRLFHPKLTLQLGSDCARLIVASANLTASGIAGNLEVVGECRMQPGEDDLVPIMQAALAFIERYVAKAETSVRKQFDWARAHSPWLGRTVANNAKSPSQFLTSDSEDGIARRFAQLVSAEAVSRLIVVSPYWDPDMGAVRYLQKELRARETALIIQPDRGLFPGKKGLKVEIYGIQPLIDPRERFAHAKIIIAQTKRFDHVLFGSPNCTTAALGTRAAPGRNVEAALYKRMAAGAALEALKLDEVFSAGVVLNNHIVAYAPAKEIPLEEAGTKQPGRFQLQGNLLTWTPASWFDKVDAVIELLDGSYKMLQANPAAVGRPSSRVYKVEMTTVPSFARVIVENRTSAPAIVQFEDQILQNLRVAKSKKIQDGLDKLDTGDLEGLFLYEALELIDAEERRISAGRVRSRLSRQKSKAPPAQPQKLSYEEFIQARAPGKSSDMQPMNSLATSYTNEVRTALNALIGINDSGPELAESADQSSPMPLGTGDDTADGDDAIETGLDLQPEPTSHKADPSAKRPLAARPNDTEDAITAAVCRFNDRLGEAAKNRPLTNRDLLRVRVLLTIVLSSGSLKLSRLVPAEGERMPVLLSRGERGWPRLAGQLLFRIFGATPTDSPLIHLVQFDNQEGQRVPVDILECLATCFWAISALALARDERGASTEVMRNAYQRAAQMYGMTILETEDLMGEAILKVMCALSSRYSTRLGVSGEELMSFHAQMAAAASQLRVQWLASRQDVLVKFEEVELE